jgi:hypothetical protein
MNNTTFVAVIALIAALALVGVLAISIVTIPLQIQQEAEAAAAETFTTVEEIPVDETDFVPCAAGGEGEEVHLTGTVHTVFHITFDGAGGTHVKFHANDQGISGTGLTTGDKYHRTGASNSEINFKVGVESTVVDSFNIIGQGNGNNFLAHVTLHITINPDGTVTAEVVHFSIECK